MEQALDALFLRLRGRSASSFEPVSAHGSARRIWRLRDASDESVIGVVGPDAEENRAFWDFSRALRDAGLPVPSLLAFDATSGAYLVEDLGDRTLFDALTAARAETGERFPAAVMPAYRAVLGILPRLQVIGGRVIDFGVAFPRGLFDRRAMHWDLAYFKYHFLKLAHIPFHEDRLESDFETLAAFLAGAHTDHFVFRDFQSRNVMLRDETPWFIDYQGGRRGLLQYDVASMLYDAKAEIPPAVRADLLDHYLAALEEHVPVDREAFLRYLPATILLRILQAMGAYGYRGFFERKIHFLRSVAPAIENLRGLLESDLGPLDLPELEPVLERVCDDARLLGESVDSLPGLTVRVESFSYKRGIPADTAGHGGGYVFDCRSLPNPGRDPAFAGHTGRDEPVIRLLRTTPGASTFLERVVGLVTDHVTTFQRRGFTSLTVAFGCTGGQHRSVYMAENVAREIGARFPAVHVDLHHREAGHWPKAAGTDGR